MSDLISREKTLDAIRDADVFVFYDADTEIDDAVEIAIRCTKKSVIESINDLPSAEPKTPSNGSITSINPENTHDRTMGDLISRQDAIKALYDYWSGCSFDGDGYDIADRSEDVLNDVPSAEPERLTDDDFEAIRIHLNAQKEKLCNQQRWEEAEEYQRIIDRFMAFASAEPENIRCKDCKHWMPYDWMFSEVWQSKNMEDYPEDEIGCDCCDMNMRANDYCSRAERRGEQE